MSIIDCAMLIFQQLEALKFYDCIEIYEYWESYLSG